MRLPIITPQNNKENLQTYLKSHNRFILQKAYFFGAILFRGWDTDTTLHSVTNSLNLDTYVMSGSAAPRRQIQKGIYTSNDAPPSAKIPFHHELGQRLDPPSYILFQCQRPSSTGGFTPIVDSREIARWIETKYPKENDDIKKGVKYKRVMPSETDVTSPIGRSWKETFNVSSFFEIPNAIPKETVFTWKSEDLLETVTVPLPGIRCDPRTNVPVFMNSIVAARLGWNDERNNGEEAVVYSDGSHIDKNLALNIQEKMDHESKIFTWQKGDILLIDNAVTMHSRTSYSGDRLLYTKVSGPPRYYLQDTPTNDVILPSWDKMPKMAFGTWNLYNPEKSVYEALKQGFRHLDCAPDYGNEAQVGKALQNAMKDKIVTRDDVFLTSKLWNTHHKRVEEACRKSMADLGVEKLDLYLVHFPISLEYNPKMKGWTSDPYEPMKIDRTPFHIVWKQMERLVEIGLVNNIGVCNMPCAMISDLLSYAEIPPSVVQVEIHPQNSQNRLRKFCKQEGIRVSAFSPLGSTSYKNNQNNLLTDPTIRNIATKYKCLSASVLIEWSKKNTDCTIVRSDNAFHIRQNIRSIPMEEDDLSMLDELNQNLRYNDPGDFTTQFGCFQPIFD